MNYKKLTVKKFSSSVTEEILASPGSSFTINQDSASTAIEEPILKSKRVFCKILVKKY